MIIFDLFRPLYWGQTPPNTVSVWYQCWSEQLLPAPDVRSSNSSISQFYFLPTKNWIDERLRKRERKWSVTKVNYNLYPGLIKTMAIWWLACWTKDLLDTNRLNWVVVVSVGRAIASNSRGPRFKFRQNNNCQLFEKTKIKKKRPGMGH